MADSASAVPTMPALTVAVHEFNPGDAGGCGTHSSCGLVVSDVV